MAASTTPMKAAGHAGAHDDAHAPTETYAERLRLNRLGMWLFFISEAFLFGALLAARFYLWGDTRPDLDQVVGLIVTSVLLLSSASMYIADTAAEHGQWRVFSVAAWITMILGLVFLFGVMIFEWGLFPSIYKAHLTPWDSKYGAVVFAMTGMHAFHVITGIALIFIMWNLARKRRFTPERHWGVEASAIYWHYVDVVWIFFYPALYLIGSVVHLTGH
ncbi:MAG: heme-copper oxidase subunit III [Anaerolineales bacterium]|nr:heme-copper oxidase subunit III [Anaerolineales bacterium]